MGGGREVSMQQRQTGANRMRAFNGGVWVPLSSWKLWVDSYPKRQRIYALAPIRAASLAAAPVWRSIIMPSPLSAMRSNPRRNATWQIARSTRSLCLGSGGNQTGEARYVVDVASAQPAAKVCRIKRQSPSYTLEPQKSLLLTRC